MVLDKERYGEDFILERNVCIGTESSEYQQQNEHEFRENHNKRAALRFSKKNDLAQGLEVVWLQRLL